MEPGDGEHQSDDERDEEGQRDQPAPQAVARPLLLIGQLLALDGGSLGVGPRAADLLRRIFASLTGPYLSMQSVGRSACHPGPMTVIELPEHGIVGIRANNPGPFSLSGTNSWIVDCDPAWLVDPGPALPDHLDALTAVIGEPRWARRDRADA